MQRRSDPSRLRQFAGALRAGSILHMYQPVACKNKFHVLIASMDDRSLGFIINSRPSPMIQRQPDLLRRQVLMPKSAHPFMAHDSFIACHDTVLLPTRDELIQGLVDRTVDHVGYVATSLHGPIATAAA